MRKCPRLRGIVLSGFLLGLCCPLLAQSKRPESKAAPARAVDSGCQPSIAELRTLTRKARAVNTTDTETFLNALDDAVGTNPTHQAAPGMVLLHGSDEVDATLISRYGAYRLALAEQVRKMDPIESTEILAGHMVLIQPSKMDATDFVKVVLQRGGVIIAPLVNELKPTVFQNRFGASTTVHAGTLLFPCSAFTPENVVTITLVPAGGENKTKTLSLGELRAFR